MDQIKSLREKFQSQLEATSNDIQQTKVILESLNAKKEQLKGAIYALDTLSSFNTEKTQEKENGEKGT